MMHLKSHHRFCLVNQPTSKKVGRWAFADLARHPIARAGPSALALVDPLADTVNLRRFLVNRRSRLAARGLDGTPAPSDPHPPCSAKIIHGRILVHGGSEMTQDSRRKKIKERWREIERR